MSQLVSTTHNFELVEVAPCHVQRLLPQIDTQGLDADVVNVVSLVEHHDALLLELPGYLKGSPHRGSSGGYSRGRYTSHIHVPPKVCHMDSPFATPWGLSCTERGFDKNNQVLVETSPCHESHCLALTCHKFTLQPPHLIVIYNDVGE